MDTTDTQRRQMTAAVPFEQGQVRILPGAPQHPRSGGGRGLISEGSPH